MKRRTQSLNTIFACWLLLGLAGRVFVPAGFMVAAGDGAWPVVPCPGAAPASHSATGHGSDPADQGRSEDREEHPDGGGDAGCFLGVSFALTAEVDAVDVAPFHLPETRLDTPSSEPAAGDRVAASRRPRGPPVSHSIPA